MVLVLGISASLRNARFGRGSESLCREIKGLGSKAELTQYLRQQTKIRTDDFIAAGRAKGLKFNETYDQLQKLRGDQGLSNSEAALAAGLWGAVQEGAEIAHLPLSPYFPASGLLRRADELKQQLLAADALLLSGPVYFGDRGSLAQAFVEFITADDDLRAHFEGKIYGGIAVGAKRNGGQETTLIYQLVDMVNLSMLGVGNNSETTSQYGGTAVGGDVGTVWNDEEGIETSIGTGARIARVSKLTTAAKNYTLKDPLRVDIWLLQDTPDRRGLSYIEDWAREVAARDADVDLRIRDFTHEEVRRCIACDICPEEFGPRGDYRCIVTAKRDLFVREHAELIDTDAVLLAAYSPRDRRDIKSVYQSFIERTRYWRRDNYILGDRVWAPLVFSELGSNQNLHIRMMTSGIRHHTVLHHPIIGFEHNGKLLNTEETVKQGISFVEAARLVTLGHHLEGGRADIIYNPLGYGLSLEKTNAALELGEIQQYVAENITEKANRARAISPLEKSLG